MTQSKQTKPALVSNTAASHDVTQVHSGWIIWDLCTMAQNTAFGVDHIPPKLCELLQTSGWRRFVVPYHDTVVEYGPNDFERFVETGPPNGLGQSIEKLKSICEAARVPESRLAVQLLMEQEQALRQHGGNRQPGQDDNVTLTASKRGNSADYALRRLKRDRPDLAAKVISGDVSIHRAAVIAGFRKQNFQFTRDPAKLAPKLIAELGVEDAMRLAQSIFQMCPTNEAQTLTSALPLRDFQNGEYKANT